MITSLFLAAPLPVAPAAPPPFFLFWAISSAYQYIIVLVNDLLDEEPIYSALMSTAISRLGHECR